MSRTFALAYEPPCLLARYALLPSPSKCSAFNGRSLHAALPRDVRFLRPSSAVFDGQIDRCHGVQQTKTSSIMEEKK